MKNTTMTKYENIIDGVKIQTAVSTKAIVVEKKEDMAPFELMMTVFSVKNVEGKELKKGRFIHFKPTENQARMVISDLQATGHDNWVNAVFNTDAMNTWLKSSVYSDTTSEWS